MGYNLADYEPVEERLVKFWSGYPDGRIETELLLEDNTRGYIVKARIFRNSTDTRFWASGLAQENVTEKGVNSTSALENCETSAIGRALANAGFAPKGQRASREEMEKVDRGPVKNWSASTTIGRTIAAVANKDEMPSETTPLLDTIPVDSWDVPFVPQEEFVTETGGEKCKHGVRVMRQGVKQETGKPWMGYYCPEKSCPVVWYHVDLATGEWVA